MIKDGAVKSVGSKEETFKKARLNSNSSSDLNHRMGKRGHKATTEDSSSSKIDRRVRTANRRELLNNRILRNQVLKRDACLLYTSPSPRD